MSVEKYYDKQDVEMLKNYDFYNGSASTFYSKITNDSVLVKGDLNRPVPKVSIILTTYKRPDLLKVSLESALNQKKFDDYEILVVDNEGEDINIETDTSRYVKSIESDKILYYRHLTLKSYITDSAVALARTEWIVILHDDDILSPYALYILNSIEEQNPGVKWISGKKQSFKDNEYELIKDEIKNGMCLKGHAKAFLYSIKAYSLGIYIGWQGAFINRDCYIAIGGMPMIITHFGDVIMLRVFMERYGAYMCNISSPTYYYRVSEVQETNASEEVLTNRWIGRIIFGWRDIETHHCINRIWKYCFWRSFLNANRNLKSEYNTDVNIDYGTKLLDVPVWWNKGKILPFILQGICYCYKHFYPKESWIKAELK